MAEVLTPDLCVIGAGSGGLAVAGEALALGASVVVVERQHVGGSGLHAGSIASKALVEAGRHAHAMRSAAAFGISAVRPEVDFKRLRNHIRDIIAGTIPEVSAERITAAGAKVLPGEGRFIDDRTLGVGEILVRARRFVIATGAAPVLPDIAGLDEAAFFTTETIFENTRKPGHVVIVGAGATGVELGQAFRRLGADVTLVEIETPLADLDPEFADLALRQLREEGVLIRLGTTVPRVLPREGGGAVVTIRTAEGEDTISASHFIVAVGRLPNLDLDIERAGIRRSKIDPAELELTPGLRTTNPRVFAVGDAAAAGHQSTQRAIQQARTVVRGALQGLPIRNRPELIPFTLYTDPEIAIVGIDEAEARRRYKDRYAVLRWPFAGNDRARARRESAGLCKLVTTTSGKVLGAGIAGPEAGELIGYFALAIANGLTVDHLARFVPAYPTLSELVHRVAAEAAHQRPPVTWQDPLQRLRRMLP